MEAMAAPSINFMADQCHPDGHKVAAQSSSCAAEEELRQHAEQVQAHIHSEPALNR